jgi:hypothetical protein
MSCRHRRQSPVIRVSAQPTPRSAQRRRTCRKPAGEPVASDAAARGLLAPKIHATSRKSSAQPHSHRTTSRKLWHDMSVQAKIRATSRKSPGESPGHRTTSRKSPRDMSLQAKIRATSRKSPGLTPRHRATSRNLRRDISVQAKTRADGTALAPQTRRRTVRSVTSPAASSPTQDPRNTTEVARSNSPAPDKLTELAARRLGPSQNPRRRHRACPQARRRTVESRAAAAAYSANPKIHATSRHSGHPIARKPRMR